MLKYKIWVMGTLLISAVYSTNAEDVQKKLIKEYHQPANYMTQFGLTRFLESSSAKFSTIFRALSCVFELVTIPGAKKLKADGVHSYGQSIFQDIFTTLAIKTKLFPNYLKHEDETDDLKLQRCISGENVSSELFEGRTKKGGKGGESIVGFSLLGLKVFGGLVAFLYWDLYEQEE